MATEVERGFGWLRDRPDKRDYRFAPPTALLRSGLPDHIDLREQMPPVYDQGNLGSCASHAALACVEHFEIATRDTDRARLSRLQTYWHARARINTIESDSGSHIRDNFDVLAKLGVLREKSWPYQVERFREEPPTRASMREHRILEYRSVVDTSEQDMAACLAEGFPFAFGFAVPSSFLSIRSHGAWLPGAREPIIGYHAVVAVGYDFRPDSWLGGSWRIRNSWGTEFGNEGHFLVPRTWLAAEAFDAWTVRKVSR